MKISGTLEYIERVVVGHYDQKNLHKLNKKICQKSSLQAVQAQ